jgi:4-hydroxyphenylpyruvate dioxygenase
VSASRRPARSIATVCLSGMLADKLDAVARAGFDGVEIFENDLLAFDGPPAEARVMAEDLGLAITLFQPFRDFEAAPEAVRARNIDRLERKFDTMQALGAELMLVCSNVQPSAIDDDARAAADLRMMAEHAAARGLRVCYEALAWGRHVNTWAHAWRIVQMADHPALGLALDSFHTLAIGDDPSGIAQLPGERVFFVQVADAPKLTLDVLSLSRHFRLLPGQGELDVAGFVRCAMASGYTGPLSLEVFNDDFRAASARMIARDGMCSLALVEAEAGLTEIPPPPRIDGVSFVEFAVDETSGAELAAMLRGLGFRRAGHHRSKDVDWYQQGAINLVLNREPDSAASEHFHRHGPSVCALGLRVADAAAAIARAEALEITPWRVPVPEGEAVIPAVRTPDGMLVHLTDPQVAQSVWNAEFVPLSDESRGGENPSDGGVGLSEVDHIAQALAPTGLPSAVLFWHALFGMNAGGGTDLTDPYGLIRSRAMISPGGAFRLPLNVSDSRQTTTGRFISAASGAGVQHIAFATADVARSVERVGGAATILPIASNYYDDILARFGLDDDTLERLQRLHLLYDRDAGGEFVHAYTDTFEDRFFFELVERRGSTGFGAANATFRLAAQSARRH